MSDLLTQYSFPTNEGDWKDNSYSIKFPDGGVYNASALTRDDGGYYFMLDEGDGLAGFSRIIHTDTSYFADAVKELNDFTEGFRETHLIQRLSKEDITKYFNEHAWKCLKDFANNLAKDDIEYAVCGFLPDNTVDSKGRPIRKDDSEDIVRFLILEQAAAVARERINNKRWGLRYV